MIHRGGMFREPEDHSYGKLIAARLMEMMKEDFRMNGGKANDKST